MALLITQLPPGADITMLNRLWVGIYVRTINNVHQGLLDQSMVCLKISIVETFNNKTFPRFYHVHFCGRGLLNFGKQVSVDAELENSRCFGVLSQLSVLNFIRPITKLAFAWNLQ